MLRNFGRRLHGRRGLKCCIGKFSGMIKGRRLHGRRGLKWCSFVQRVIGCGSPPSRAAWIEIVVGGLLRLYEGSPPSRAAWIEIL